VSPPTDFKSVASADSAIAPARTTFYRNLKSIDYKVEIVPMKVSERLTVVRPSTPFDMESSSLSEQENLKLAMQLSGYSEEEVAEVQIPQPKPEPPNGAKL